MTEPVRAREGKAALGSMSVSEPFLCGTSFLRAEGCEEGSASWADGDGVAKRLPSTAGK